MMPSAFFGRVVSFAVRHFLPWLRYRDPDDAELSRIEDAFSASGVSLGEITVDPKRFAAWKREFVFPEDWYGGGGVREEKMLEHFLAHEICFTRGRETVYMDVAACASPWVKMLRERGYAQTTAIDLVVPAAYETLGYYRAMDATATDLSDESLDAASLQCAFEMFEKGSDIALLRELARILRPGGKALILPLYMRARYSGFSSAEMFPAAVFEYPGAAVFWSEHGGVPFARMYDVPLFMRRVWQTAEQVGLVPQVSVVRNKNDIHDDVYLHFVLELTKR